MCKIPDHSSQSEWVGAQTTAMKSRSLTCHTVLAQYIHTIPTVYYVGHIAIKTLAPLDSTAA